MEIVKIILFFFKASSIALAIWLSMRMFKANRIESVLSLKDDSKALGGLFIIVLFLTTCYAWFV